MAILQRTLASGSIWIGTSSSVSGQDWSTYNSTDLHLPFAILRGDYHALDFNSAAATNILYLNTTSIRSANYISGFDPTNQGNKGFAIDLINNRYVAEFDDLWVRGTMNVHEFVINQIRATNGSLWVSDAAKAIEVQNDPGTSARLRIFFETGSTLPFISGDIIRSKRWVVTQGSITNWDVIGVIESVDYNEYSLIINYEQLQNIWIASAQSIGNLTQSAGSEWVRIGNTSDPNRQGGIYLTAGDNQSPYIDIYDSVSTVAGGHYNDSGSIDYTANNSLKLRLGKLSGIDSTVFGTLQGYGLYADNAYLKGKIWANEGGNIAGWTIAPHTLSNNQFRLVSTDSVAYLGIGAQTYTSNGIWIGSSSLGAQLSVGDADSYVRWDGSNLSISTPNLSVIGGNVSMSATVSATAGLIGGWTIGTDKLYSSIVTLSAGTTKYLGIGASSYSGSGIYIGSASAGYQASFTNLISGLFWDGTNLGISTSNFRLSQGNIWANNATLSGSISSSAGYIGGWNIDTNRIQKVTDISEIELRSEPSTIWNYVESSGYVFDVSGSTNTLINIKRAYCGASGSIQGYLNVPWEAITGTSSITQNVNYVYKQAVGIKYTSSGVNSGKSILTWKFAEPKVSFEIQANQTVFLGIKKITINAGAATIGQATTHYLDFGIYAGSGFKRYTTYTIPDPSTGTEYNNTYLSYTNTSTITENISAVFIPRMLSASGSSLVNEITVSGMVFATSRGYTELNPYGVLIYASPSNYLKFTTHPTGSTTASYGVLAVDRIDASQIYLDGKQFIGQGGTGGAASTDLDGTTAQKFTINSDGTSADSQLALNKGGSSQGLIYDGSQISSTTTLSAPVFGGDGFKVDQPFTISTTAVGKIPAGSNVSGFGLDTIVGYMLAYPAPTLGTITVTGSLNGTPTNLSTTTVYQQGSTLAGPWTLSCLQPQIGNYNYFVGNMGFKMLTGTAYQYLATVSSSALIKYENATLPAAAQLSTSGSATYNFRLQCTQSLGTFVTSTNFAINVGNYVTYFTHSSVLTANAATLAPYTASGYVASTLRTSKLTSTATQMGAGYHYIMWPKAFGMMTAKPYVLGSAPAAYMTYHSNYNTGDGNTPITINFTNIYGVTVPYYVVCSTENAAPVKWVLS